MSPISQEDFDNLVEGAKRNDVQRRIGPCWKCGPAHVTADYFLGRNGVAARIRCDGCGAMGPMSFLAENNAAALDSAAKRWNAMQETRCGS